MYTTVHPVFVNVGNSVVHTYVYVWASQCLCFPATTCVQKMAVTNCDSCYWPHLGTLIHVLVAEFSLIQRSLNPPQYYTWTQLCPYCRNSLTISEGCNEEVPQYNIQTFSSEIIQWYNYEMIKNPVSLALRPRGPCRRSGYGGWVYAFLMVTTSDNIEEKSVILFMCPTYSLKFAQRYSKLDA